MAAFVPAGLYWLTLAVFAILPTFGLVSGPAYAPLVFGLAGLRLIHRLAGERRRPDLDHALGGLALAFALSCWASALWSINPAQTLRSALQVTLILAGGVIFLMREDWPPAAVGRLFLALAVAILIGAGTAGADMLSGYKLTVLHSGWADPSKNYKYNRGITHLLLLVWPVMAYFAWRGRMRLALAVAALTALPVVFGLNGSARMAALAGLAALVLTGLAPRRGPAALKAAALALPIALPFLLQAFPGYRGILAPHIPSSGLHRLEIWDYMTARVIEHPLAGWGFSTAKSVPIHAEEIARYVFADHVGIHPHNQWLDLWVGLGAWGMALGAAFLLLVLARIARLPGRLRPFAYAAFASAHACSFVNYELSTDSWWAALAACTFLFTLAARAVEHAEASKCPQGF